MTSQPAPLVTLAIPTYRRPEMLRRALSSVVDQHLPALDVLVADNATEGDAVVQVVESFRDRIPGLRFVRHAQNIGALNNFMYCLAQARGDYFMWLADDDELAPDSVAALLQPLVADPSIATVVPHWRLKRDSGAGVLMPQRVYEARSPLRRALRYVWRANDAFYYGLHRRSVLQACRFVPLRWPNAHTVADTAYLYLMPLVLAGRVVAVADRRVQWINHAYTEKSYARPEPFIRYAPKHLLRRINVHAVYCRQIAQALGVWTALLVVPTSAASLLIEFSHAALRKAWRTLRRG